MKYLFILLQLLAIPIIYAQTYETPNEPITQYTNQNQHQVTVLLQNLKYKLKPKNIILLIGDGMGVAHIYAAYTANKGQLNILQLPTTGFSITTSKSDYITDSAAGGTAIASGVKTNNQTIGLDSNGDTINSILHIAKEQGLSAGLVSTSAITHATPASFIAHNEYRKNYECIALDFIKHDIDLFIGGGLNHFNTRADGRILTNELQTKGFEIATTLQQANDSKSNKLAALISLEHPEKAKERGEMLMNATQIATNRLSQNKKGFFLMIEGSQIDWGGHNNDLPYLVDEMLDFDKAVGVALEFAMKDKHTLVIVTSDHETGGMSLLEGDINQGSLKVGFNTTVHTGEMVPVFAYGPGASKFTGVYQNTEIFNKMLELYQFKPKFTKSKSPQNK